MNYGREHYRFGPRPGRSGPMRVRPGYGGYPGPRRSEQWGRYDLGYRRGHDRGR